MSTKNDDSWRWQIGIHLLAHFRRRGHWSWHKKGIKRAWHIGVLQMLTWLFQKLFKDFLFGKVVGTDRIPDQTKQRIASASLMVAKELVEAGVRGATDEEFSDIALKFKKEF